MLWTLQKYIFREMGKSFLLTAVGLIVVLGLGGGVMNMIELEGVTALQILRLMGLVLPVAASLTLPIAALYSATVTYGRLSADNEFVACRSGGINLHILLLPTLVISLFSALCSFFCINFVIPGMIMNIDRFVTTDMPRFIKQQLAAPGRLALKGDNYRIYADKSEIRQEATDSGDATELHVEGVAFVEMDDGKWTRFGTAESIEIAFTSPGDVPTIAANMYELSIYDAKTGRYSDFHHESIGQYPIPEKFPLEVKWLVLGDLLRYRQQPSLFPEIDQSLVFLRAAVARAIFYAEIKRQFLASGEVVFGDKQTQFRVRSRTLSPDPQDNRPRFEENLEIVETRSDGLIRTITADSAFMKVAESKAQQAVCVSLEANGNVEITTNRFPEARTKRNHEKLTPVKLPDEVVHQALSFPTDRLLDSSGKSLGLGTLVDKRKAALLEDIAKLTRDITGELHSRLAISVSVFVLVILGAALAIVLRGSQVLVAFGISFIPSLFVISTIIMGKQLIDNPETLTTGISVVWLGIVVTGIIDLVILTKALRR